MIQPAFEILNQRGTPMFFSDIYANIPTAGIVGRIFISTDTKEFYRDTGTTWELIGGPGSGTITGSGTAGTLPIWTSSSVLGNSSLLEGASKISTTKDFQADAYYLNGMTAGSGALYWTSDRVTLANYNSGGIVHIEVNGGSAAQVLSSDLSSTFYGNVLATQKVGINKSVPSVALDVVGRSYILDTATYSTGTIQSQTIDKQLTIPNGASISNGVGLTSQLVGGTTTFQGSVTIPNTTALANNLISNSFAFSGAGTITLTQAAGLRTSAASMIQSFFSGSASSTITHYSAQAIYGFYNINSGSITPVIQNAYMLLINDMNDYSHTFTFNNRWGIYQAGTNDKNYFAANMLLGSVIDNGNRLQVNGNIYAGNTGGDTTIQVQSFSGSGSSNLRLINTSGTIQYDWNLQGLGSDGRFRIYDNAGSVGEWFTILQNGNVGIGSTSPTQKLTISSGVDKDGIRLYNTTFTSNSSSRISFQSNNGYDSTSINAAIDAVLVSTLNSATNLVFSTAGDSNLSSAGLTARMTITGNGGNVGIGVTPSAWNSTFNVMQIGSTGSIYSRTSGTEQMGVVSNGYFASGTNDWRYISSTNASYYLQSGGVHYWLNAASGTAGNPITFTQAMTLTSTGNLLVGTSVDSGQRLQVSGNGLLDGHLRIIGDSYITFRNPTNTVGFDFGLLGGGSDANGYIYNRSNHPIIFGTNNTSRMQLSNDGNLSIGSTSNPGQKLYLNGSFRIDGQTSGTAGGNSGQHLIINCDGTTYKIALLNP